MKRSSLVSASVVAVLSLSACTGGAGSGTPSPTPSAPPSASVSPTPTTTAGGDRTTTPSSTPTAPRRTAAPHTPRATPESPAEIRGDLGQVPDGFSLPEEGRPADDETTAFTTTVWRASCHDRVLTLGSASGITATRVKESVGPEHVVGNGLLVFGDDAAAQAFLGELRTQLSTCTEAGPSEGGWRSLQATGDLTGFGHEGLQISQWTEWDSTGTWIEAPGSGLQYIARKGRFIALTYEGGEFLGDPADLPDLVTDAETRLTVMLDQL